MFDPNPLTALAGALNAACARDLPAIRYLVMDEAAFTMLPVEERRVVAAEERRTGVYAGPTRTMTRRPHQEECSVVIFPQTWATSAMGYDDSGVTESSTGYTIVVECAAAGARAVYFGGSSRLAYLVPLEAEAAAWADHLHRFQLPDVAAAAALGWRSGMR